MLGFIIIWFGQVISLIGSGLTQFALGVWLYQTTGSVTQLSLIYLFTELPYVILAPVGGTISDRWNKRWIMLLSDSGSGICTLFIVLLMWQGWLETWQIYLLVGLTSACKSFQEPTYYTIPTIFVPIEQYSRANGMIQLGQAAGKLFSPVLAGFLVNVIKVHGIIFLDFITFSFAFLTLLIIPFPKLAKKHKVKTSKNSVWREMIEGWNYLVVHQGLLLLLMFFVVTNFAIGLAQVLITPLVLSFANPEVLGRILSLAGIGWLWGGILMSIWKGFKRRIHGIFIFELLLGICILGSGLRPSALLITTALFIGFFSIPIIITSANAIRQVKVAPEVQGRVFALWGAIAWSSFPLAYLVAGPLADKVFEPLLMTGGLLSDTIGAIIGVGQGRGIGLLFILLGALIVVATAIAYQDPRLRLVEEKIPDVVSEE